MADLAGGDFGAGLAGDAKQTGQNAINTFNPQDIAGRTRSTFDTGVSGQLGTGGPQTASDYMSRYSGQIAKQPTYTDLYQTANDIYGVQPLTQQAAYLRGLVGTEVPRAYETTRGFDVSDPQVQNKIATDLRFLNPQSQMATEQAQAAQGLAGQYVGYGQQQQAKELMPIQNYGQMLSDAFTRQATGWTIAAQQEFDGLKAKMDAGMQLSANEYARANQLAQLQEAYQQSQLQANAQIQTAQIGQQYHTLGKGDTLVSTGAVPGTRAGAYNPFAAGLAQSSTPIF